MTIKLKGFGEYYDYGGFKIHDDIQIEGFSLGESLLKYFKKKEIQKNQIDYYEDNTFIYYEFKKLKNFKTFDNVGFFIKSDDKEYKIHCISATKFTKDLTKLLKKIENIIDKFKVKLDKKYKNNEYVEYQPYINKNKSIFKYPNKKPFGKGSISKKIYYNFQEDANIQIASYKWAKDANPNWFNNVDISYSTFDFNEWLAIQSENF